MPLGTSYIEELWIGIKADYESLRLGLIQAQNSVRSFAVGLTSSSDAAKKFGTQMGVMTAGMVAFGAVALKTFADFEQSMQNTFSVLGASKGEMQKMTDLARELGQTTVYSAKDVGDAMYFLASAGYNAQQTMDALKGTLTLAASTQFDLSETTKTVVNTLNAFGMQASDAGRVANVFAADIAYSQAEMDKLAESMKFIAPVAAQVNIPLEQVVAALGKLYDSGLDASQAGTNLRQVFLKLLNPSKQAQEALKTLGLSKKDVDPVSKDLVGIVEAFEKVGASAPKNVGLLAKIFDARAIVPMLILIRQGSAALLEAQGKITNTNKAAEMMKTQMNSLQGTLKLLVGTVKNVFITIGETLSPAIRMASELVRELLREFNLLPAPLKTVLVVLPALVTAFGLLATPIVLLVGYIPKIIAGWTAMTTVMTGSVGVAIGWTAVIVAAIAAISMYVAGQKSTTQVIKDNITAMNDSIASQIEYRQGVKNLADEYIKLSKQSKLSKDDQDKMNGIYEKLKSIYPSLIKDTADYKDRLDGVKKAAGQATGELETLFNMQKQMKTFELRMDISSLKNDINAAKKDLGNIGFFEEFTPTTFDFGDKFSKELDKIGLSTKKVFNQSLYTENQLTKTFDTGSLKKSLGTFAQSEGAINSIMDDNDKLSGAINEKRDQYNQLLQNGMDKNSQVVKSLNQQVSYLMTIQSVYTDVGKQVMEIGKKETDLAEKQQQLSDVNKIVKPERKKATEGANDPLTDEEKRKARQLQADLWNIQKEGLESRMKLLQASKEDSFDAETKYLDAKFKLDDEELEYWHTSKSKELDDLGATNAQKGDLETTYQNKITELADLHNRLRKESREHWDTIEYDRYANKVAWEAQFDTKILEQYRQMLEDRLKYLEDHNKKWTNEYASTISAIHSINESILANTENVLKFKVEISEKDVKFGMSEKYAESLKEYRDFLEGQLLAYQEWSDKYIEIMNKLEDTKDKQRTAELNKMRFLFLSIQDIATISLETINAGISAMFDRFLMVTRQAKDNWDAVWIAMENAALKALSNIVENAVTALILKIIQSIVNLITSGGGTAPGTIMEGVDSMPTEGVANMAATGGEVIRSGMVMAHAGETFITGSVKRKTEQDYMSKYWDALASNFSTVPMNKTSTVTAEKPAGQFGKQSPAVAPVNHFHIYNPVVSDKRFWERMYEDYMIPAQIAHGKRTS